MVGRSRTRWAAVTLATALVAVLVGGASPVGASGTPSTVTFGKWVTYDNVHFAVPTGWAVTTKGACPSTSSGINVNVPWNWPTYSCAHKTSTSLRTTILVGHFGILTKPLESMEKTTTVAGRKVKEVVLAGGLPYQFWWPKKNASVLFQYQPKSLSTAQLDYDQVLTFGFVYRMSFVS